MFRLLLAVLSLSFAASAYSEEFKLEDTVSGNLPKVISLSINKVDNQVSYSFINNQSPSKGKTIFNGMPNVLLVDLNFDGYADLWVNGCTTGQCRTLESDAWLYDSASKKYKLNQVLSALPDLNIDIQKQVIVSGVANTGCAGMSFYLETFRWQNKKLTKQYRCEQQCTADSRVHYFEYKLKNGVMAKVRDEIINDPESANRRNLDLDLLDTFNYQMEM